MKKIIKNTNSTLSSLNNSKFFAGIVMIMLNIGSKYITIELSKSQEAYLKYSLGRQLLIFSIAWMGTRDIILSLILTAVFIILADYLFNEDSYFCILPNRFKELKHTIDKDGDGVISEKEINDALKVLDKANKQKSKQSQLEMLESLNNV